VTADRATVKQGRKRASESRAAEFCERLAARNHTPKPQRISLRALARELGTSHQLLSHYLAHLEKWQAQEYRRRAKEIRARAEEETRPWIVAEMLRQSQALEKAAFQSMLNAMLDRTFRQLERSARRGELPRGAVRMLRVFANRGYRNAREILEGLGTGKTPRNNLPSASSRARKSFGCEQGIAGNSSKLRPHAEVKIIVKSSQK